MTPDACDFWEVQIKDLKKQKTRSVYASRSWKRAVARAHQEAGAGGPNPTLESRRVYLLYYRANSFIKKVTVPPFSQLGPWPLFAKEDSSSEIHEDILDSGMAKRRHEY